jgi:hypothetical protein
MAEYINLIVLSGLCVTLFFGGWHVPWVERLDRTGRSGSFSSFCSSSRSSSAARVRAAVALRPADALRLEGASCRWQRSTRSITAFFVVLI